MKSVPPKAASRRAAMARLLNRVLDPLGVSLSRRLEQEQPWDAVFESWTERARASGEDPNDAGDREWGDAAAVVELRYAQHLSSDKVVLELGPGSGRYTRHLLKRCAKLIAVDSSPRVVRWLEEYLAREPRFSVFLAQDCSLSFAADASVDVCLATGVFEHLSLEQIHRYLEAFARVLRPGGVVIVNFDDFQSEQGYAWFKKWLPADGSRGIFRFYHPEMIRKICDELGFQNVAIEPDRRMAWLTCNKPPAP
jgi:cyclopropane fatty-acyl-phospholipid synthase-like methyltransferase